MGSFDPGQVSCIITLQQSKSTETVIPPSGNPKTAFRHPIDSPNHLLIVCVVIFTEPKAWSFNKNLNQRSELLLDVLTHIHSCVGFKLPSTKGNFTCMMSRRQLSI